MIADMGTKPLSSSRLKELRRLLGMEEIPISAISEDPEEKKVAEKLEESLEMMSVSREGLRSLRGVSVVEAERILRLITLAASLQTVKSDGEEEDEDLGGRSEDLLRVVVGVYTILVILAVALVQWCWSCMRREKVIQKQEEGEVRRVEGEVRRVEGEVRRVEGEVRRVEGEVRRVEGVVTKVKSEKEEPFTKVTNRSGSLEFDPSTPKSSTILVAPEVHRSAGSGGDVPKVCQGQGLHHELPQENDFGNQRK